jgi:hypothetical protein
MGEPRTIAELLDDAAAVNDRGEAFGAVIQGLFSALEKLSDDEKERRKM